MECRNDLKSKLDHGEDPIVTEIFKEVSWELFQPGDPVLDLTDIINFVSDDSQSSFNSDLESFLHEPNVVSKSPQISDDSEMCKSDVSFKQVSSSVEPEAIKTQLICLVCGNAAGKHCYYGGQVCVSCRAFFRRAVLGKSYSEFKCSKEEQCVINSKSWKSCRFCRFQKCLQSGMRIAWVTTEDKPSGPSKGSKAKPKGKLIVPTSAIQRSIQLKWTLEEECYVRGFYNHAWENWCHVITDFYARHPVYFASIISVFLLDFSVENNPFMTKSEFYGQMVNMELSFKRFWFTHPDMNDLCQADQEQLVNENNDLIFTLCRCVQYLNAQDVAKYSRLYRDRLKERASQDESCQNVVAMLSNFTLSDHPEDNITPNTTTSLCLLSADDESKSLESSLMTEIQEWNRLFPHGPCDPIMQTMMGYLIIFDPNMKNLQDYKKVCDIQTKFLHMLQRYLKAKVPKQATKKIGQAVEFITKLRTLSNLQRQARSKTILEVQEFSI